MCHFHTISVTCSSPTPSIANSHEPTFIWYRTDFTKKPTSHIYALLPSVSLPPQDSLRQRNVRNLPFWTLVSLCDWLFQLQIVHRAYFTSSRLHKMNPSECWRCGHSLGDSRIFWTCPAVSGFWTDLVTISNLFTFTPVPLAMEICLLGLVDNPY